MPTISSPTLSYNTTTQVMTVTDSTTYSGDRSNYGLVLVKESISNDVTTPETIIEGTLTSISSWNVDLGDGVFSFSIVAIPYEATLPTDGTGYVDDDYIIVGSDSKIYQLDASSGTWSEASINYSTYTSTLIGTTNTLITTSIERSINSRFLNRAKENCYDEENYIDKVYLNSINNYYLNNDLKKAQDLIEEYQDNIINY